MIRHVVERTRAALPGDVPVVLATSEAASDDPLAAYGASLGIEVFRGQLDDVLDRFLRCSAAHPSEWILRVNGDSPFVAADVVQRVVQSAGDCDVVTTTFPRTFPRGLNVELIRATALRSIDGPLATASDREHVTAFFYRHPDRFRIVNVASADPELANSSIAVDTLDDLVRLERMSPDEERRLLGQALAI